MRLELWLGARMSSVIGFLTFLWYHLTGAGKLCLRATEAEASAAEAAARAAELDARLHQALMLVDLAARHLATLRDQRWTAARGTRQQHERKIQSAIGGALAVATSSLRGTATPQEIAELTAAHAETQLWFGEVSA